MSNMTTELKDNAARRDALTQLDRSILVEAGAGSGKTAIMAGRIAYMLAAGIAPRSIAAITFTELAASELLTRVREFAEDLAEGNIPRELLIAFPNGLSDDQKRNLIDAAAAIDEITCATIHGFCQRLIKPYPAEANIDPGAALMDRGHIAFLENEIIDGWMRARFAQNSHAVLDELILTDPNGTSNLIRTIFSKMVSRPNLSAPPVDSLVHSQNEFKSAVEAFAEFYRNCGLEEPDTAEIIAELQSMVQSAIDGPNADSPAGILRLFGLSGSLKVVTKTGSFRAFQKKAKWAAAATQNGVSKPQGQELFERASELYKACELPWSGLKTDAVCAVIASLIDEVRPVVESFKERKRQTAALDFDDLILSARNLLSSHDAVRIALGQTYAHVLVDEFQDTDPLQSEILWRLCGDPKSDDASWQDYQIRLGALFLVGDPKQAIYRFRGADISAYVQARDAFQAMDPHSILSISSNFRSCASVLSFVNERFEAILSEDGQPGFTALNAVVGDVPTPCVAAIDIPVAVTDGKVSADMFRDMEAEAIADVCARLIGSHMIADRKSRQTRPCKPGDIALLAPTGTDLWRYEEALERLNIPVAAQAGKGFFRRQEIQDLIAITRVLADRRDGLALGSLLRGPLVGLSEQEMADLVWNLPRAEDDAERIPRLNLNTDPDTVKHSLAAEILHKLQSLSRKANTQTPHQLLTLAVNAMRVRPLLMERHKGHAERALANVDLFLNMTSSYAVRGLRAFSEAMMSAWDEGAKDVEGRPDAQEEAVSLVTMHSSKGLEWPVVIPINTSSQTSFKDSTFVDSATQTLYLPVLKVQPTGYQTIYDAEKEEIRRERIRLWYVTATRARELLLLPRFDEAPSASAWINLLDLSIPDLPALDLSTYSTDLPAQSVSSVNSQTRDDFKADAEAIYEARSKLRWLVPSRDEEAGGEVLVAEQTAIWTGGEVSQAMDVEPTLVVKGGRERGLILHKLMEEVINGETRRTEADIKDRAEEFVRAFGRDPVANAADGLAPTELAQCVMRTLSLPVIVELQDRLVTEFPVYSLMEGSDEDKAIAGIADALTFAVDGTPEVVIDWKSDVEPSEKMIGHYRAQVQYYLYMTSAKVGLIVFMTSGQFIKVQHVAATAEMLA